MQLFYKLGSALAFGLTFGLVGCQPQGEAVDLLVTNAKVYTVDSVFSQAQAFAVRGGRFIAVGSAAEMQAKYQPTQTVDAAGSLYIPAFTMRTATFTATRWGCARPTWWARLRGPKRWGG